MALQTSTVALTALATVALAGSASAGLTTAAYMGENGVERMGAFTASVTFDYSGGSSAYLSITLTNTTSSSYGGYITAFALSTPTGCVVSTMLSSSSEAFKSLEGPVNTAPFGTFEAGAAIGNTWNGGGTPQNGLGIGQSATFMFLVSGSPIDLTMLSAGDVLRTEFGLGSGLAVRFRGMDGGGSDKVLGFFIPGPGGLVALAMGAACTRRRRR